MGNSLVRYGTNCHLTFISCIWFFFFCLFVCFFFLHSRCFEFRGSHLLGWRWPHRPPQCLKVAGFCRWVRGSPKTNKQTNKQTKTIIVKHIGELNCCKLGLLIDCFILVETAMFGATFTRVGLPWLSWLYRSLKIDNCPLNNCFILQNGVNAFNGF